MDKIWIACFDIGKKNFAFVIEEINIKSLKKIENIKKNERYKKDGLSTKIFSELLSKVYKSSKIILLKNLDLTKNCNDSKYLDPKIYINMIDTLDKYTSYWDKCSAFIIEQQMSFGRKKQNTMAIKLGQHCYSYFSFYYRDFKLLLEFPSYYKTNIIGAPKNTKGLKNKSNRKKWR